MLTKAQEVLKTYQSYAVIGVSREPEKYGHEVFAALLAGRYQVYPINPKYADIDGHPCYASLKDLPALPQVVVVALGPQAAEKVMPGAAASGVKVVWMPPGCFTQAAVDICQAAGVDELHDICPVFALASLQ